MVTTEAIFVGCNKELQIFDYNPLLGNIAYGAKNTVAITSPFLHEDSLDVKVIETLKNHRSEVSTIKWLPLSNSLLSGSEDGSIDVWSKDEGSNYTLVQTLSTVHKASITSIGVVDKCSKVFISGDASGFVDVWKLNEQAAKFELFGEFEVSRGFYPLALSIDEVIPDQFVMFIGGTRPSLYVYSFDLNDVSTIRRGAELTGHEDWIKSLAVKRISNEEYLIASGSQDRWIRLWKLCLNKMIDMSSQDSTKLQLLSNKLYRFDVGDKTKCAVNFDAIIMGHDDWISDLRWHPKQMKLLSSSADTSVMIWKPDAVSGVWVSTVRLGEMTIKGASTATGASGGFFCAEWILDEEEGREVILTNGKTGSFRCWQRSLKTESSVFEQATALTGPTRDVTDVAWSSSGRYLLATSLDQTTRLFGRWTKEGGNTWHEFARPQIHGYDMICIKPITDTQFVSAGDEKVIRIFNEPRSVAELLGALTDVQTAAGAESMPESASIPVLGLSNKAELEDIQEQIEEEADEPANGGSERTSGSPTPAPATNMLAGLTTPPFEDHLQRYTLWPEIEKLYGHGFEVTTLDVSPDKKLIASACRSNVAAYAGIRIFRTDNWQQLEQTLLGHELTITRIRWSPRGDYLLSVSRDRQFSLWQRLGETFELVCLKEKAHTRIIWDCCWIPAEIDECMFITGARDKRMNVWRRGKEDGTIEAISSEKLTAAVTSLDSYPVISRGTDPGCLVAAGLDDGSIHLYAVNGSGEFRSLKTLDRGSSPDGSITRIAFKPPSNESRFALAVASRDNSVRIYSFTREEVDF
ncbi:DEKNAAC100251 [Brettanomyces naardenensis]|uniref:Elongator complex protein 2 n=1 Tax=Brettanomyces naardenensis TaxID=13370 RepID=A0A448YFH4_BRENA|nr:DEKNAAC100251 [Brettanomyces naardenensis]